MATDGNLNFTIDYGNAETIDTLDYFVTKHPDKALTGTHALSQTIVGNSSYYAKAGAPDKFFEYHTWDNNYVYLTEDTAGYTFSPGIWMKRKMAVGEKLDEPGNLIRRYDNNVDCNYQSVPQPFPYSMTLLDHIKFDIGGDLGNQDVIRLKYDYSSGANSDYEIFYYSKEWGWIQWEYYHNGSLVSKSVFNKIDPNPPAQIFAGNLCTIRDKNKLLYPNMTCNPGSFRNCKICNSNGSAWVDASSKCVAVLGKVVTSAGQPVPDVKIALCDQGFATTNSKGGWSVFVTPGRSYCARIDSGLPPGYVAIAASNSRNCQANNPSYEWQVAGRNEFVGCFATENQAWDLSDDDSLDFTINYAKKCNAKNCSSLNYECGTANDGCGGVLDCGICASGKTCSAGVCVAASSGGGGGGGNPTPPITPVSTKPVKQMTRAEILAAIARIRALIADLQKQLTALTGTTTSTFSCTQITKNLFYSISNDPQVKCLQEILKSQGYTVVVSGNYDAATKAAVALFQQKYASEILAPYHLTRGSGNVGNATRSKINSFIVIK